MFALLVLFVLLAAIMAMMVVGAIVMIRVAIWILVVTLGIVAVATRAIVGWAASGPASRRRVRG